MIYHTTEERMLDMRRISIEACRANGFDVWQEEADGHTYCGKAASDEFVDVYPDGSWEYKNDGHPELNTTGTSPVYLRLYFHDPDFYRKYS